MIQASPRPPESSQDVLLEAHNLHQHYEVSKGIFNAPATVKAVNGVSFSIARGKTLAIVGESGCGKSTLARMITAVESPLAGDLKLDTHTLSQTAPKIWRQKVQMVFQDPYGSLNPRKKIFDILAEPLVINTNLDKNAVTEKVLNRLQQVGLRPEMAQRYPHMFSGGQRQRIAIARALMLDPDVIVLDEPVSALDVSVQAQVLNLLSDLQQEHQLSYLFISHDLSVVRHIADDVLVMYLGKQVELAPRDQIFSNPQHPYTQALLSATPSTDPTSKGTRIKLTGEIPSPLNPPSGCPFHPRCHKFSDICHQQDPASSFYLNGSAQVSCHHAELS